MEFKELIGRKITNIYIKYELKDEWLDQSTCWIQIDEEFFICFPSVNPSQVLVTIPDIEAESIFHKLKDIPTYHINKEGKSIKEAADAQLKRRSTFINRIRRFFFNYEPPFREYIPYEVTLTENKLKYVQGQKVVDVLYEPELDDGEAIYIELENGFFISHHMMSPHGTGRAGLSWHENLETIEIPVASLIRYTEHIKQ